MPDLAVAEYIETPVSSEPPTAGGAGVELAALRPAPHRDPAVVAQRAAELGLQPYRGPAGPLPLWPLLVIFAVAVAYLYVGLVAW